MLGSIIGDIAGSFREFKGPFKNPELGLLPDKKDIAKIAMENNYGITDDTVLTLATFNACFQLKKYPVCGYRKDDYFAYYYKEYANKYDTVIGGYGSRFKKWAMSKNDCPYNSCGNGSAMRVSPVAYVAESLAEVLELAFYSAIPTHNHPEGIRGAQSTAVMIYLALNEWSLNDIIDELKTMYLYYEPIEQYNHFDSICQETMRLVMHCLITTDNFHDAVFKAVTIPYADSDTLGAIVGSIAEALYGIPDDIKEYAESFIMPNELTYGYLEFKRVYRK